MLIPCKECGNSVSDKAYMCPKCGCPVSEKRNPPKSKKHPRLPNGFGQITEIKGRNLRKPFRVMVTVGKTEEGKPICKILKPDGYFETYREAYAALVKYNTNPYDLDKEMTMQELYDVWSERHFKNLKPQSYSYIQSSWNYCSSIYTMKVREVRVRHLKSCIEEGFSSANGERQYPGNYAKEKIKNVLNMMFDYAVEYELTDKNYARSFNLDRSVKKEIEKNRQNHISFSDKEMQILWDNKSDRIVGMMLIQCYTGLRPRELLTLKISAVDLNKRTIVCGMKTADGIDRTIPIHDCIYDLLADYIKEGNRIGSGKVFNCKTLKSKTEVPMSYSLYRQKMAQTVQKYDLNVLHRAHDPRKHFATMAKKYKMDEYAIKRIIGHHISDITEAVYTDRDDSWLHEEIAKIRVPYIETNV